MTGRKLDLKKATENQTNTVMEDLPQGYKHTMIGIIPCDWETKRLGDVAQIHRGASPRPINSSIWFDENSSIGWVRISDVTRARIYLRETDQRLSPLGVKESRLVNKHNLIMSICATVGLPIITDIDVCIHDGFVVFDDLQHDKLFLYHLLMWIQPHWVKYGQTGSQMNLNTTLISNTLIQLPPHAEQQAIAEALTDVDGLIEALEKLIEKKKAIKLSAMQQLLTGKTRLPGFSSEWEIRQVGDLGQFLKGSGISRENVQSGLLAFVRYGEIYTTHNNFIREFQSWISEEVAKSAVRLECGDILFTGSGETKEEIGKCVAFLHEKEAYAGGDIIILRPRGVDSLFLGYALNSHEVNRQKASLGQGDAIVHISAAALGRVSLLLPPLEEQTAIATVLSDMDAEIDALERRCEKMRAIKQGMMQQLLTGRIRLVKPVHKEEEA